MGIFLLLETEGVKTDLRRMVKNAFSKSILGEKEVLMQRKKKLSLILALVLTASLLLPMATPASAFTIQYFGHSQVLMTTDMGTSVLMDPPYPYTAPFAEDPGALYPTVVTSSHEHSDHNNTVASWIYGAPSVVEANNVNDYSIDGQSYGAILNNDVHLYAIPINHFSASDPFLRAGMNPNNGAFVFDTLVFGNSGSQNLRVVHLGDSQGSIVDGLTDDEKNALCTSNTLFDPPSNTPIDILFIPLGDPDGGALSTDSVLKAVYDLKPKVAVPIHYWSMDDLNNFLTEADTTVMKATYGISAVKSLDRNYFTKNELPAATEIWAMKIAPQSIPAVAGKVKANGVEVDDVKAFFSFDPATNLAQLQLWKNGGADLSGGAYDSNTEFTITINNNGHTPYILLGAGQVQSWETSNGVTTIRVKGMSFKFPDGTPVPLGVQMAIAYDANLAPYNMPASYQGMTISTNASSFNAPAMVSGTQLYVYISGVSGETGSFKVFLPDALLQDWGITSNDQLAAQIGDGSGDNKEDVTGATVTDVTGGKTMEFSGFHYSDHRVYVGKGADTPPSGGGGGGGSTSAGSSSTTVTANSGGTVTSNGATIVVPVNAVTGDIKVTVEKVANPASLPVAADTRLISDVFEITKDKVGDFIKAVTITLPFDKAKVDAAKYDIGIFWFNPETGTWIKLDNIIVDLATGKVSGDVTHFTKFAALAVEKAGEAPTASFSDIAGHWAQNKIEDLVALGVLSGYPDGTFKPDNTITRAEFATALVKAFKLAPQKGKNFADTAQHWARDYIATAASNGIVNGYDNETFGPDDLITREQMAVMIVKAKKLTMVSEGASFEDGGKISAWAGSAVATAAEQGIINGYPDNTFNPAGNATRAEAVTVLVNAIK